MAWRVHFVAGEAVAENSISVEEFARLQDELMALRMYHEALRGLSGSRVGQELLGEKRWLQAEKAQMGRQEGLAAQAAQASRSISSQVKARSSWPRPRGCRWGRRRSRRWARAAWRR